MIWWTNDVAENIYCTYAYNGLHWRVLKTVARTSLDEQRETMYSSAWQLLQEHIDDAFSTNPGVDRVAQEVWGPRYVDDAVARRMRTTSGNVDPTTYYHITDAQFSTMAMLQGAVLKERVEFDAYGRARHYWASDDDGDGAVTQGDQNAITAAANANPQLQIGASGYNVAMDINRDGVIDLLDVFAFVAQANRPALAAGQISDPAGPDNLIGYDGYVFNMENMLYTVRFRHYDPQLGRWVQRDPYGTRSAFALLSRSLPVGSKPVKEMVMPRNAVYLNTAQVIAAYIRPSSQYNDGMNIFQYVTSSPRVLSDPSGLDSDGKAPRIIKCNISKMKCMWAVEKALKEGTDWTRYLHNCPCKLTKIGTGFVNPNSLIWKNPSSNNIKGYHDGAAACMRSKPNSKGAGQQCCYNSYGALITGGTAAGTPDKVSPGESLSGHYFTDVKPFEACKDAGLISEYLKGWPPNKGKNMDGTPCKSNIINGS